MLDSRNHVRILLVEDSDGDARLAQEYLASLPEQFELQRVETLAGALEQLRFQNHDVALLDLVLPDSVGTETVTRLHEAAPEMPIVVLTSHDDEELGFQCIRFGAQDYLPKDEIKPATLRRAVLYARSRQHEKRRRELERTLENYQALSKKAAARASLCDRAAQDFLEIGEAYRSILAEYMDHLVVKQEKPFKQMEALIDRLGSLGAGPQDLIDVHVKALEEVLHDADDMRSSAYTVECRLFGLEMMGLLVDYYRIGVLRLLPTEERA